MRDGKWSAPVELGPPVNSPADEATPFISPNGDYLIFQRDGDRFSISYRNEESWTPPRSLGDSINTTFKELCPIVSPDGRYLFFLSDRLGQSHVFWVATAFIERLRPDGCVHTSTLVEHGRHADHDSGESNEQLSLQIRGRRKRCSGF